MAETNYNEVLAVSIDTSEFESGLQQLRSQWEQFVQSIGSENVGNVISAGAFSGLMTGLEDLKTAIAGIGNDATTSLNTMVEQVTTALAEIEKARVEAARGAAESKRYDDVDAQSKADSELDALRMKRTRPGEDYERDQSAALAEDARREERQMASAERIAEKQRKLAEEIALEQQGLADKEGAEYEQAYAKAEAAWKRMAQEIAAEQQALEDQFVAKQEADAAKAAAARSKYEKQFDAERMDALAAVQGEEQRAADLAAERRIADAEKVAAAQKKLAEEIAIEQQGLLDRHEEAAERQSAKGGGLGMLGDVANVAKWLVMWQAVGLVIEGVTDIIKAPVVAIKEGAEYLEKMHQTAEELSGVLLANGKFSDDFAENLKKSQQAAEAVVVQLQNLSIKDNLKAESLQNIFRIVTESGGGKMGSSVGDLVKLTEAFGLLERQVSGTSGNMRLYFSEIEKFLNGTLPPSSKLLDTLGMTAEQAKQMVEHAREHHDLLAQLGPILEPYLQATDRAALHQAALVEKVDILKQRWEALVAGPAVAEFERILQAVLGWAEKNQQKIDGWGIALGNIVGTGLQLVEIFGNMVKEAGGLSTVLAPAANMMLSIVGTVNEALHQLRLWQAQQKDDKDRPGYAKALSALNPMHYLGLDDTDSTLVALGLEKPTKGAGVKTLDANADYNRTKETLAALAKQIQDIQNGHYPTAPDPTSSLGAPFTPIKNNPSTDRAKKAPSELPDVMAQYQTELEAIKSKYQDFNDQTKHAIAQHTISWREGATAIKMNAEQERAEIDILIARYTKLIETSKDASTAQGAQRVKTDVDRLRKEHISLNRGLNKEEDNADDAGAREAETAEQREYTRQIEAARSASRLKISEQEKLYKAGKITQSEYIQFQISSENDLATQLTTIYRKEMDGKSELVPAYQAAADQIVRTEAERALRQIALSVEIEEARRKEQLAAEQHSATMQATSDEYTNTVSKTSSQNRGTNSDTDIAQRRLQDIQTTVQQTQAALAHAAAIGKETDQYRRLSEQLARLQSQRVTALVGQLGAIANNDYGPSARTFQQGKAVDAEIFRTQGDIAGARSRLQTAGLNPNTSAKVMTDMVKTLSDLNKRLEDLKDLKDSLKPTDDASSKFQKSVFGQDLGKELADKTIPAVTKFADTLTSASNAAQQVMSTLSAIKQGGRQGGILGGVGAGLSSGLGQSALGVVGNMVGGALGAALPGIGAALGPILGMIGQMFMGAAIRIANQIKTEISNTMSAYQAQAQNLNTTLAQLESERTQAIEQLSGVKGGKDKLNEILPQLNDQISSLMIQQRDLATDFSNTSNELGLQLQYGTDALSQIYSQWVQINKQVTDYINAGGDLNVATQYMSNTLQQMQITAQQTVNQGMQQAVQDALQLNDLLYQRQQLMLSLNQQAFALQNQDAMERTEAGAVNRAQQVSLMEQQSQQQLQNMDYEITTAQLKVTAESQVFQIAQSIADLHRQDDQLTLNALQQQLNQYTALQSLITSITQGTNGLFNSTEGFLQPINNPLGSTVNLTGANINIYVNSTGDPTAAGSAAADSFMNEIYRQSRNSPVGT